MNKTKYGRHTLQYQAYYLTALTLIILAVPLFLNWAQHKPLLSGEESYYFLSIVSFLPGNVVVLLLLGSSILSIILFRFLAKKIRLPAEFQFFFLLFLIISPAFIKTFTTLSAVGLCIILVEIGFFLLWQEKYKSLQYFSVLPFALAAFVDIFSALLVLLLQLAFIKKKKILLLVVTSIGLLLNIIFFQPEFFRGPFHVQQALPDLISDLGGHSGMSLFLVLLAIIGVAFTWKKKNYYKWYLFLPVLLIAYIFSTQTIFYVTLLAVFFATVSFIRLAEDKWQMQFLQDFTIIIIILSLLFSSISFLQRTAENEPSRGDVQVLEWVRENTHSRDIVFSTAENGPFITYFAHRTPFSQLNEKNREKEVITQKILNSTYIGETFPLLERNKIAFVYITPAIRQDYPQDQGLLFLFKNERFKLRYAQEGHEIWEFLPEK